MTFRFFTYLLFSVSINLLFLHHASASIDDQEKIILLLPDTGNYEIQNQTSGSTICVGEILCEVSSDNTISIRNHTDGTDWSNVQLKENVLAGRSTASITGPSNPAIFIDPANGTVHWQNGNWIEVQDSNTGVTRCENNASCPIAAGTSNIIDHTSNQRWENIFIVGARDATENSLISSNGILLGSTAGSSTLLNSNVIRVSRLLSSEAASRAQITIQQSSIAYKDNNVFLTYISENHSANDQNTGLDTVVTHLRKSGDTWDRRSVVIDSQTIYSEYHTPPSIAVDKNGYIHVAYNMHNTPWQYVKSKSPLSIEEFEFAGQKLSQAEFERWRFNDQVTFRTLGTADIPGNQITYPRFYTDKYDDLWVTYRFASKPRRKFAERAMSAGIARYDAGSATWSGIGGSSLSVAGSDYDVSNGSPASPLKTIAQDQGWTAYFPRLGFDASNNIHISFNWREGIAGSTTSRPCYIKSNDFEKFTDLDNNFVSTPIQSHACSNIGIDPNTKFNADGDFTVNSAGDPYFLMRVNGGKSFIRYYEKSTRAYKEIGVPSGPSKIFFDGDNNLYLFTNGWKLYRLQNDSQNWSLVAQSEDSSYCFPKFDYNDNEDKLYVFAMNCHENTVAAWELIF